MSCPTQDHRGRGSVLLSFAMTDADRVFQHSHGTARVTPRAPQIGVLVNFCDFYAAVHILRANCAKTIEDRPG